MSVFLLNKEYSSRKQAFIKQQYILELNFQDIDPVLLEKILFSCSICFNLFLP